MTPLMRESEAPDAVEERDKAEEWQASQQKQPEEPSCSGLEHSVLNVFALAFPVSAVACCNREANVAIGVNSAAVVIVNADDVLSPQDRLPSCHLVMIFVAVE